MDHIDKIYRNRIAALTRALYAMRCVKEDNVPCKIEEGLLLGSVGAASNKNALKSLNITHILTVANLSAMDWSTHPNDFMYKTIDVADREDTDIAQYFDECFDFIDEAKRLGGRVLVHCFVGRSRSVTVVVSYLMKKNHLSLSEALELVRSKRPQAAPNSGFMLQIQNFEKSLKGTEPEETRAGSLWAMMARVEGGVQVTLEGLIVDSVEMDSEIVWMLIVYLLLLAE
ncbi:dual specificity protein phosphatase 1-like [Macadamia integrifolia]|uniref:dual specificity protein phosphatase 1-like n=1 Tax=Macadamia integrifolia TaxID=60698 RepID=UPI001C4F883F|nr:dual specificity protein phosphatase 1-like [Macadamia integrifolia]